jgi:membrane associated rhomboid family serine protease
MGTGTARRPPSQFEQLGLKPDRGVLGTLIVLGVITVFFEVGGRAAQSLYGHVVLTPALGIGPEPWQILTSGFVTPTLSQLLMTAISMIFFGNQIEARYGARAFLKVFIGGGIAATLAAAIVGRLIAPDVPVPTALATGTALLMAFGSGWSQQRVMAYGAAEMRASTLAWVFLGVNVLFILFGVRQMGVVNVILMLSAIAGAGVAGWFLIKSPGGRSGGLRDGLDRVRLWRLRRRYTVLQGGRGGRNDKTYLN